jgi:uncharacterized protein
VTIITDPLFYALAVPAVVALGLSKGGFAGAGQMATPLVALVMPPLEAAAVMLPIMILQDISAVWVYRKGWNGRVLTLMFPGAVIGVGIAWLLAAHISDAAVRVFIASITIAFVLYQVIGPQRVAAEAEKDFGRPGVIGGTFWGALSGFSSTISQAGGPPYQIYVMRLNLPKMMYVSTTAILFAALNWLKVVPYVALGQFTAQGLATSAVLMPLALATNALGFWVVRRTPERLFYNILYVLLFLISIELLRSGLTEILRG